MSKNPKVKHKPNKKQARIKVNPENYNTQKIVWGVSRVDLDSKWGWQNVTAETWWDEILPKLKNLETMTWQELLNASGGRTAGNNSHSVSLGNIVKQARDRLIEMKLDDIDEIFSLRLSGKSRIWGTKDGRALKIIWYDPNHEICPSAK